MSTWISAGSGRPPLRGAADLAVPGDPLGGPALKTPGDQRQLLWLFLLSAGPSACSTARDSPGASTPTSRLSSTGAGGWCISGWKASSRSSPPPSSRSSSRARSDQAGHRRQGGAAFGHHLSVRRHHRHLPSPVLLGNADRGAGVGLGVQRARSGAAHAGGLLGSGRSAPRPLDLLGGALQVAHLLLRRRRVLEHGGRRFVRLHDQSARSRSTSCRD